MKSNCFDSIPITCESPGTCYSCGQIRFMNESFSKSINQNCIMHTCWGDYLNLATLENEPLITVAILLSAHPRMLAFCFPKVLLAHSLDILLKVFRDGRKLDIISFAFFYSCSCCERLCGAISFSVRFKKRCKSNFNVLTRLTLPFFQ